MIKFLFETGQSVLFIGCGIGFLLAIAYCILGVVINVIDYFDNNRIEDEEGEE